MNTCIYTAESLCCAGETITAVLTHYTPTQNKSFRDFLGGPLVKTSPSSARGMGSIPGLEAKIPLALEPEKPKYKEQKQYCNKFNNDLQNKNPLCILHFQALFWKYDIYQPRNKIKIPALGKPISYWSRWTGTIVGKF